MMYNHIHHIQNVTNEFTVEIRLMRLYPDFSECVIIHDIRNIGGKKEVSSPLLGQVLVLLPLNPLPFQAKKNHLPFPTT